MRVWLVTMFAALMAVSGFAASSSIEIILDASRSMNAQFDGNRTRIEGARAALEQVVGSLPAGSRVAFRAYGHQSPTSKHDCDDTALLLPFKPVDQNAKSIIAAANRLTVQGYTPITKVLGLAAKDFTAGDGSDHVIILVSDGKETCGGDPCATAAALRRADVKLVIHTVGLGVDVAARSELHCVANAGGGHYFDARSVTELTAALKTASVTAAMSQGAEKKGSGALHMLNAGLDSHIVRDSAGMQAGKINAFNSTMKLPAGTYSVEFGALSWRGIEVVGKETTTIDPGKIEVQHLGPVVTVQILDPETGSVVAKVQSAKSSTEVLPGIYDLRFSGGAVWPSVRIDAGPKVVITPGLIHVSSMKSVPILNASRQKVGTANSSAPNVPLPPGDYIVMLPGGEKRVTLAAGQVIDFNKK